jgi:hypothetical protein
MQPRALEVPVGVEQVVKMERQQQGQLILVVEVEEWVLFQAVFQEPMAVQELSLSGTNIRTNNIKRKYK